MATGGGLGVAAGASVWSGRTRILFGAAATERAVQLALRRTPHEFAVLHFATHAIVDNDDPLSSHLRLAADTRNDGLLHLSEIIAQHMAAPLVVLSGCETLGGRLYEGEGFMGLARAFIAGGAHSVVATQWPIGPATSELMTVFYRRLAMGDAPARALRAAKLELKNQRPEFANPFFWAAFVLIEVK